MDNDDQLDKTLKSAIDDSLSNIEASKDIFSEAWSKKDKIESKRSCFSIYYKKKVVASFACFIVVIFLGVFVFSPETRVAAQEVLKKIFLLDKQDKVVERTEEQKLPVIYGGKEITAGNKMEIEKDLGFKINLPEKIDGFSVEKVDSSEEKPMVAIEAFNVKYKDAENVLEKLRKSLNSNKFFEALNKEYKIEGFVNSTYMDNKGHKFRVTLFKLSGKLKKGNVIKKINIDNIECVIYNGKNSNYHVKKTDDGYGETDMTKKPISVDNSYDMEWNYRGVSYCIYIGKNSSDINFAIQFAKDYIKILKKLDENLYD